MIHFKNIAAVSATAALVSLSSIARAADDDLLDDLFADEAKPAAKAEAPAAESAKPAAPVEKAEEPAAPVAEAPVAESAAEPAKPEASAEAAPAEEKPAAEVAAVSDSEAELIANIRETEKLRREAYDQQALREIEAARACMKAKDFVEAVRHYGVAQKLLNDRPASAPLREECAANIAEGLYRAALQEKQMGRRERAEKLLEKAIAMRHPLARKTMAEWNNEEDPGSDRIDYSDISHRRNDKDFRAKREKINKHLRRARQLLSVREIDAALDECEMVLVAEPYNQEALRLRRQIVKKRHVIVKQEKEITREGMIADVDKAWRPVYAPNAREIENASGATVKKSVSDDPQRTMEQSIVRRMKEMKLPAISFKPPATIIDAVEYFRAASKDYDNPEIPIENRGFNFVLKSTETLRAKPAAAANEDAGDFSATSSDEAAEDKAQEGVPVIPMITASNITFYDALKLVCESVDYKFKVQGPIVMVMHKDVTTEEMMTRSYPVVAAFLERMDNASADVKDVSLKAGGFGARPKPEADGDEENQEAKWKKFFTLMGVQWPEGSSILYIKTIGKLRVKNTYDNLAELEKALTELNVDQKLIEIEARFVEVKQEDLNSLGFEWILNSDYTMGMSEFGEWLNMSNGYFGSGGSSTTTESTSSIAVGNTGGTTTKSLTTQTTTSAITTSSSGSGQRWYKSDADGSAMGVNAFGGSSDYTTGQRYLSTVGNHISGTDKSTNDRFMKLNAFIGNADLSMILHMLSQRSDTDLLNAPKVLTRPGEQAVIKVVNEFIYPTDYDVQLQSSSSSGSSSSGSSQSAILAVVEPQSFTMREVGVILDVTPTLTDDGNLIDLQLNTQVVDEPTWEEYGMKIPFTGNTSLQSFTGLGEIFTGLNSILETLGAGLSASMQQEFAEQAMNTATYAMANLSTGNQITYYEASMRQPIFHVRSIDSKVSVYPGATIVMGGLIREERAAMDDKIPFLGDLPFVGRLFRSHAEQTVKSNLLIFITTRLVDVRGREVSMASDEAQRDGDVKPVDESEAK